MDCWHRRHRRHVEVVLRHRGIEPRASPTSLFVLLLFFLRFSFVCYSLVPLSCCSSAILSCGVWLAGSFHRGLEQGISNGNISSSPYTQLKPFIYRLVGIPKSRDSCIDMSFATIVFIRVEYLFVVQGSEARRRNFQHPRQVLGREISTTPSFSNSIEILYIAYPHNGGIFFRSLHSHSHNFCPRRKAPRNTSSLLAQFPMIA